MQDEEGVKEEKKQAVGKSLVSERLKQEEMGVGNK